MPARACLHPAAPHRDAASSRPRPLLLHVPERHKRSTWRPTADSPALAGSSHRGGLRGEWHALSLTRQQHWPTQASWSEALQTSRSGWRHSADYRSDRTAVIDHLKHLAANRRRSTVPVSKLAVSSSCLPTAAAPQKTNRTPRHASSDKTIPGAAVVHAGIRFDKD